ncbi:MAG: M23 family peptidase, partial [Candidatus Marinimicrobia bacterium]|nr:M23 family peptidase [Candidatus Neomarinimicrobiota bacterium]
MKHYYISSLLVLLMLTNLHGQDYLWPVDLPRRISSNFGETRPRRFHAGLDIQTKGVNGFELK